VVLNKEYKWTGERQLTNPKPGKPEKIRPLGIPSINDRLVQEVVRSIIEPIFELTFLETSFGFRPNRGCHTALKFINTRMKDSSWFVVGDIKGYFDNIDHNTLIKLIQKRVKDPLTIELIKKGLKAKVFAENNRVHIPEVGSPQGGILSPLLSNIYLHELDKFIEELTKEYQDQGRQTRTDKLRVNPLASKLLRKGLKSEYYRLKLPYRFVKIPEFVNCKYVRYADDFLVGILGPSKMALEIKERIRLFLKTVLKIELSNEQTKITHVTKNVPFLGYNIGRKTIFTRKNTYKLRMVIPTLDADMSKVIARLYEAKFCDKKGDPTPA
jgi:group II intron reverse transcriptase/maturase